MSRGRALGPGRLDRTKSGWAIAYTDENGHRRRRVVNGDRRSAERVRSELVHRRDLAMVGMGDQGGMELPLAELLRVYLDDLRLRASERHFVNVSQRLRHVVGQLGEARVGDLKPLDVTRIRNEAVQRGASRRTANLLVGRLVAMLRWAELNELVGKNPLRNIRPLPESGHRVRERRALSESEIARLLSAANEDDEQNGLVADLNGWTRVPQVPMWRTLVTTGIRYGEMRQLVWGDLDFQNNLLTVRAEAAKSRRQRVIPLRQDLVEELKRLRVVHEDVLRRLPNTADHVFVSPEGAPYRRPSTNINRVFRRVLDRAGIARIDAQGRRVDVHGLRHTAATRYARAGVSLLHAARLLGHADARTTSAIYMHLEVSDLRASVDALPPLGGGEAAPNTIAIKEAK